jgi:hypothetical protein
MHWPDRHRAVVAALLAVCLVAGCAGLKQPAPTAAPASSVAPDTARSDAPAAPAAAPAAAPRVAAAPPAAAAAPAKSATPTAKAPEKAAAPAPAPPAKASPTVQAAKSTAPPLDLKALETGLKETKAIGVMTKLSLKNQVDDLLSQFRAFYQGKLKTTLAELRRPFDLLVLKLLALLQDSDPSLAAAIVASREAIWGILSDPAKFASLDGG